MIIYYFVNVFQTEPTTHLSIRGRGREEVLHGYSFQRRCGHAGFNVDILSLAIYLTEVNLFLTL